MLAGAWSDAPAGAIQGLGKMRLNYVLTNFTNVGRYIPGYC